MAQFTLPANSVVRKGRHFPAPEGASRTRSFRVYRWDPDAGENPRMEATVEAMRKSCEWRAKTGYYDFFSKRLDKSDDFHKFWPETIHGCDKYGHFLQCLRAGDVDADSLEKVRRAGRRAAAARRHGGAWRRSRYRAGRSCP